MKFRALSIQSVVVSSILLLAACEVTTPGGVIPDQYIQAAQQLVGTYRGGFDSRKNSILVKLTGKVMAAQVQGAGDLLGSGCNTKLGKLIRFDGSGSGSSYSLNSAVFELSSACAEGSDITFTFDSTMKAVSTTVVASSTTTQSCPSDSEINSCVQQIQFSWIGKDPGDPTDDFGQPCSQSGFPSSGSCETDEDRQIDSCSACSDNTQTSYYNGYFAR